MYSYNAFFSSDRTVVGSTSYAWNALGFHDKYYIFTLGNGTKNGENVRIPSVLVCPRWAETCACVCNTQKTTSASSVRPKNEMNELISYFCFMSRYVIYYMTFLLMDAHHTIFLCLQQPPPPPPLLPSKCERGQKIFFFPIILLFYNVPMQLFVI